jgi:aspartyl-tRNA(Asn)/glutamyl-tRNA(Gln) amidotransferase subunit A
VQRLLDAGAVPVGKTNCDEFAMGSSTENSAFGPVGNPWDVERVPGGSSGGSAAAVGAGIVPISYGTDTGGSIRQPASLCGVVGFKPTYGRVSRYGLIAFASSLDQVGPFAHTVGDAAAAYVAVAGNDPRDSTSVPDPVDDPLAAIRHGVSGMRIGVPREYMGEGLEDGVRERVTEAIAVLESLGASIEEVSLPSTDLGLSTYYIIAPAECSSNLARYDGVRFGRRVERPSLTETFLRTRDEGFGDEVKRRVMLGTYALSSGYYDAYYRRAQKVRTLIAREFDAVFESVDALVCPTSPKVAFTTGAIQDPLEMYLNDALTIPVNLAGLPGISVPCGFSDELPVGLQVIAPRLHDARVFQVAAAYESATEWHLRRAPLVAA